MSRNVGKLIVAVSGAALVALLVVATGAQAAPKKVVSRSGVSSSQAQPPGVGRSSYGYQVPRGGYDRYNMPPGGGINFNDGRFGANFSVGGP